MLAAPYYSLPTSVELFEHFRKVDGAIGVPIMIYNYPGRTGVDMSPEFLARLADKCKHVKYVKESTGEMARIATLRRLCGTDVGVFCGCDTIALQAFLMGASGWLGGVVNVLPRGHVMVYKNMMAGDFAAAGKEFEKMLPLLELMEGGGRYTAFVKAACGMMGQHVGLPRMPLGAVKATEATALKSALKGCREIEKT
jgi:4-hydroxy-tetrahydrodipicolinate synthase